MIMDWIAGAIIFMLLVALCLSPAALITYLEEKYKEKDKEDDSV